MNGERDMLSHIPCFIAVMFQKSSRVKMVPSAIPNWVVINLNSGNF